MFALTVFAAVAVTVADRADGAIGDFRFRNCAASGALAGFPCTAISGAGGNALAEISDATASFDGRHVYTVSESGNFVLRFDRNPGTGTLTLAQCITGSDATPGCSAIPTSTADGSGSGLDEPSGIAISPDDEYVYVSAAGDDAIAQFTRNLATGALTYDRCISGDTATGSNGTKACVLVENAQPGGNGSGLDFPGRLAVGRSVEDAKSLYVLARGDTALSRFDRSEESGRLGNIFFNCDSGDTFLTGVCEMTDDATPGGIGSGLLGLADLAIHPSGTALYTLATSDEAVGVWAISDGSHDAAFVDCLSGNSLLTPCRHAPRSTPGASGSGMDGISAMAMRPEGSDIYLASPLDSSIYWLHMNQETELRFGGCITGKVTVGPEGTHACSALRSATPNGVDSGLAGALGIAVSGDGQTAYLTSPADDAVTRYDLTPRSGNPAYIGCETGSTNVADLGFCSAIENATATGANTALAGAAFAFPVGQTSVYVHGSQVSTLANFTNLGGSNPPPSAPDIKVELRPSGRSVPASTKNVSYQLRVTGTGGQPATAVMACVEFNKKRLRLASGARCRNLGNFPNGRLKVSNFKFKVRPGHRGKKSKIRFTITSQDAPTRKATATLKVRKP